MKPKVFVSRKIPEAGLKLLRQTCTVKVQPRDRVATKQELSKGAKWADALLCLLTDKIDAAFIKKNKHLKIIANFAVGYDNVDVKTATALKIPVTNTPGVLTDTVAEHTVALLFGIAKRLCEADQFTRTGKYKGWAPQLLLGTALKGKTLGIIGLGRIGSGVAMRCTAMDMKILYDDIRRNKQFEKKFKARYVSKERLLKTADFVTLHVPLLKATHHLIGAKELRMMKKGAYLINTSRGPVVDEKALVSALKTKQIRGAAIDVYEFEPKLAPGLNKLDNIILTPHTASATDEARDAMAVMAAKNVLAAVAGRKPPQIVNKEVYA